MPRKPGEYLITLADEAEAPAILEQAFGDLGLEAMEALKISRPVYIIRLKRDPGPQAMKERSQSVEGIRRIQPNFRYGVPRPPGSPDLPGE
jgi:hypothetical protein